jgi:hypothetical protein
VSKDVLGRGLGELLKTSHVTDVSEASAAETRTATLSAGVRTLLGQDEQAPAQHLTTNPVPLRLVRLSLFAADVLLCALVALLMTRRGVHLNAAEVALCIGGIAMGAWFACLALRCR